MAGNDFFRFDKPLFPALIRPLFVLALICTVYKGAHWIWLGLDSRFSSSHLIVIGLAYVVIGPLVVRVIFEALLSLFRIESHLAVLRERRNEPAAPFPPA